MRLLLYHEINADEPGEIHAVPVRQFAAQMQWLRQTGYTVIRLDDWIAVRAGVQPTLPRNAVVITFDDGYLDNYTTALPVLQAHCFPATIFLVSGLVGQTSRWREGSLGQTPLLTWAQVRVMTKQGIDFGSHTYMHSDLTALDLPLVERELCDSRDRIEQQLGYPVTKFSYPYSRFTPQVKRLLSSYGYQVGCSSPTGYVGSASQDAFELQRITVLANDSLNSFARKVRGSLRGRLEWYRRVFGQWRRRLLDVTGPG